MSKFRVGDRVVRVYGNWMNGARGTIVGVYSENPYQYQILLDDKYKKLENRKVKKWGWHENYIELEEIVDSPLYKLMKEEE